ncbi:alpha/beta hydrolase [Geomonas sp. RF6]|uniref:esterase/lipase family protein n=1 Tax=Geomonas sp. RF6 TaxID=2897342 RepID=UPI001E4B48FF|nr:alpha/beta hydrolase [Geomonas sp. RF6]UFS70248.1 alpha/beta hydrolase [Geomonas sp. RF6]
MMKKTTTIRSLLRVVVPLLLLSFQAACVTPIGVKEVTPSQSYHDAYANPLSAGVASDQTKAVLNRYDLLMQFKKDQAAAIAALHARALHDQRRDLLYALSETSYLCGERLAKSNDPVDQGLAPDYFLLSAIYAYLFLLDDRSEPPPTAFDQRFRNACNLYNFSLWRALATGEDGGLVLAGGMRKLPLGSVAITLEKTKFPWQFSDFSIIEPADKYAARGISVRNRTPGMGLPLIALKKANKDSPFGGQAVPVTAFLRIHGDLAALSVGTAAATLELHSTYDDSAIVVNNRLIPLEADLTTPLAYILEGASIWGFGTSAFLGKEFNRVPNGLYLTQPYQPGRIPVVFVHGTASSPVWWVEMFNTLRGDPELRCNYQFWYFVYSSNAPVAMSAADLRDELVKKVATLDPEGKDPALGQMVVVGHSQGGLLTKFLVVDTGEKLVRSMTGKGIEALEMSVFDKERLRHISIVKPLPFVKDVVFIATPHRGSFRSKMWVRKLVRSLITLPATVVSRTATYYEFFTDDVKRITGGNSIATSADGMSPDNPLLKALADMPLAPGVRGHSIIAVLPGMDIPTGNDGVVEYKSAHLEGMQSELVVRSEHSCQGKPQTIEEVRRILLEHLPTPPAGTVEAPD